jgi:hypothetical protein
MRDLEPEVAEESESVEVRPFPTGNHPHTPTGAAPGRCSEVTGCSVYLQRVPQPAQTVGFEQRNID